MSAGRLLIILNQVSHCPLQKAYKHRHTQKYPNLIFALAISSQEIHAKDVVATVLMAKNVSTLLPKLKYSRNKGAGRAVEHEIHATYLCC